MPALLVNLLMQWNERDVVFRVIIFGGHKKETFQMVVTLVKHNKSCSDFQPLYGNFLLKVIFQLVFRVLSAYFGPTSIFLSGQNRPNYFSKI